MNLLSEMARAILRVEFPDGQMIIIARQHGEGVVRAALSAALKHGWKLVPVEPTEEMFSASWGCRHPKIEIALEPCAKKQHRMKMLARYRAMIEAAPSIEGDG